MIEVTSNDNHRPVARWVIYLGLKCSVTVSQENAHRSCIAIVVIRDSHVLLAVFVKVTNGDRLLQTEDGIVNLIFYLDEFSP